MRLRTGLPLWVDLQPAPEAPAPLTQDLRCDVVVLGGGISGALTSYRLTEDGVSVVLLDRGPLARGSTAASTGLLLYEVDTPLVNLIDQVGEAAAVRAYRRGREALDEIEQLVGELDDACGFGQRACLYFASAEDDFPELVREAECRVKHGFDVELMSRDQLAAVTSIQAPGALRARGDGQIDPYRFTLRLIEAAVRRGLRVFPTTTIRSIDEGRKQVLVRTEHGSVTAERIVYATGYDAQPLLPDWKGTLHSTYVLASAPLRQVPGWPDEWLLWETARPYFYARRTEEGRVLLGGADTPFADDHQRDSLVERQVKRLLARFHEMFPGAAFEPEYAWAGTFAETRDGLAYIGTPPERPRASFALGYGGNGITFAVIAARLIADLYAGRPNPDAAVFRFGR